MDITGTAGSETLTGTAGDDVISGLSGNDTINGGAGNDIVDGGDGNDWIHDDRGSDTLRGGAGNDRISISRSNNNTVENVSIEGGTGDDTVTYQNYSAGSVAIDLGDGADRLELWSTQNGARVTLGTGRDTLELANAYGIETGKLVVTDFAVGATGDVLDGSQYFNNGLSGWNGSINPFGASGYLRLVQQGTDTLLQVDRDGIANGSNFATLATFENTTPSQFTAENFAGLAPDGSAIVGRTITGTAGSETLTGTAGDDVISGLGGNDTINGGAGNDLVDGGDGDDWIRDDRGSDTLRGGAGNDRISISRSSNNTVENVSIEGGTGDDTVTYQNYSAGSVAIDLGDGADRLELWTTQNSARVTLGTGRDTLELANAYGIETGKLVVTDFAVGATGDVLDGSRYFNNGLSGWNGSVNPFGASGYLRLVQQGANTLLQVDRDGIANGSSFATLVTFENTTPSQFAAENFAGLAPDGSAIVGRTITGTAGSETLMGTAGDDVISGLGGNDTINGGAGNDLVDGGDGNDRIEDSRGSDTLRGGAGNDRISISRSNNNTVENVSIEGGTGDDTVTYQNYSAGSVAIDLGDGADRLQLWSAQDSARVTLGTGRDTLELASAYGIGTGKLVVTDFATGASGDVLDGSQYFNNGLSGWNGSVNPFGASGYLRLVQQGANTLLQVDRDGIANGSSFATLVTFENTTASQFTAENFAGLAPRALGSLPTVALLARSDSGVAGDGITKSTRPTFVGQADPGSVVKLFVDDVVIGTAKAGATGAWSFTPTTALIDGPRIVTASVIDGNGLEIARSESFTVTIDTIGPDVTGPVLVADDNTGLAGDRVTARTAPAFTGTAERDAVVTIFVDNVAVATVNADQNGTWHYTADTLAEGKHRIGVRATDIAGNVSATRTATFTIDTAIDAPTLTGLSARSDTGVKGDDISRVAKTGLTGTAEAGATVTVFVDGTAMGTAKANSLGQWSFTNPALSDGLHDAYVTAVDAAGNASMPSETYSFTVDTLAPTLGATLLSAESDSGAPGDGITNIAPVLDGVAEAGSTVTLTIDGVEAASIVADAVTGAWSYAPTDFGEGRHSVSVRATDIAGNASATKKTYVTFDTVAAVPVVTGLSAKSDSGTIGDNITKSSRPVLTGSAEAGATVTLYADDVAIGSTKAASNGAWSITLSEPLGDGTYAFSAAITDLAGNASARSSAVNVTVDTVAPTAGLPVLVETSDSGKVGDNITNDYTPTLTGVAEAGNSVTVRIDGKDVATVVADSAGQWEYTPTALLSVGQHKVVAIARDTAGNIGKASSVLALNIEKQVTALAAPALTTESDTGKLGDGITSNASPTLAGVVDAGATVTITLDGRQIGTVAADSTTGAWSYRLATPLDDGAHLVSVKAGGAVVEQLALTIDTIDPSKPGKAMIDAASDTGIIGDGRTTTTAPLLRGTAEANGTVQLYIDNRKVATVATDATGAWSYLPEAALSVGDHVVQIRAADAAGNVSDKSDPLALRIQSRVAAATLTTGVDDVVADDSGITVTGMSATLTVSTPGYPGMPGTPPVTGDQLVGGTGYDTLQLFGGGEYRIDKLGAFTGFERVLVTNPGGNGQAQVYLGNQAIELAVSHDNNARFYLGSGKVTFESSVSGSVAVTSADNWNVANVIKGVVPTSQNMWTGSTILIAFGNYNGGQTFDLRSASLASVSIQSNGPSTFLVNSAVMAGVTSWYDYSYNGESKLSVADASIDLGSTALSFTVVSTNATGTTFTTSNSLTALQVQGGAGQDTLVLKGSALTVDQRNAIFSASSIETITDTSGTYRTDPDMIRLTTGVDKITAPSSGITVTGTSATLTASTPAVVGDQLIGGTGYDTLQLFGGGEYRIDKLGAFTGFERVLVTNPGGSGDARVYLGSQAVELGVSHAYNATFYLGSGKVTFESIVSGSVAVTSADNWNVANVIKGVVPTSQNMWTGSTISITFGNYNGGQTFDLRSASLASVSIQSNGPNTFLVNSAVMAGVTSWSGYSYSGESKLSVADTSIDLGSAALGNYKVVSTNVTGTTFTTGSSFTALQVQGGAGQDTLVLKGSALTVDQRNAIFATSSVETITDTSGTYQADPGMIRLTTGVDKITAPNGGIMLTATSATLTASTPAVVGDQLVGGTGYDTLQLFGGGEYRIDKLGAFTGFERVLVTNPGSNNMAQVYLGSQAVELSISHGYNARFYLGTGKVTFESSVYGSVTVTSADNWNVANVFKGVMPTSQNMWTGSTISITFGNYGGAQTFDLRSASLASVSIESNGANTFLVNNAVMAGVTNWYNYNYNNESKLSVADASIDLGSILLSNYKVVSTNATGTTFTTSNSATALQVQGGAGQDTLVLKGSALTADQRNAIFATSSIETITDTSGTYTKSAAPFALSIDTAATLFGFGDNDVEDDQALAMASWDEVRLDSWNYLSATTHSAGFSDILL